MNCPVCKSAIVKSPGENTKDFHCDNYYCSSRSEAKYFAHLSIRPDWYFVEKYHLPFKSGADWFCVCGPEYSWEKFSIEFSPKTILQRITIQNPSVFNSFSHCTQQTLLSIPYMALPANQDFNEQFNILVERVMGRLAIK